MIIGDETRFLDPDSVDQSGDCDALPCSESSTQNKMGLVAESDTAAGCGGR
jgi:hypothetical protein